MNFLKTVWWSWGICALVGLGFMLLLGEMFIYNISRHCPCIHRTLVDSSRVQWAIVSVVLMVPYGAGVACARRVWETLDEFFSEGRS